MVIDGYKNPLGCYEDNSDYYKRIRLKINRVYANAIALLAHYIIRSRKKGIPWQIPVQYGYLPSSLHSQE
ncbi:hypothetical protein [Yersinia pestis]|uniref:hypothetical protein n=3 Tax=Yersinia pestis TaxID=632 RepID=UPI00057798D9|nr:hypothetical protein [Yersinia pestis]QOW14750.1 hypothetical protein S96127_2446 [Yersinia pestis]